MKIQFKNNGRKKHAKKYNNDAVICDKQIISGMNHYSHNRIEYNSIRNIYENFPQF